MKEKTMLLIQCVLLPLTVGALSALLSGGGMREFQLLNQPPLSPPGWLFPVVWTILYILMGIASYLVIVSDAGAREKRRALLVYGLQLFVNFFWSILFFRWDLYLAAFLWLLLLWSLIFLNRKLFGEISKAAGALLLPYLLWVTFAGYLNLFIFLLNP